MRVLHVINSMQLGGAEMLLRHLAPILRDRGIDINIYLLDSHRSPLVHDLVAEGTEVYFSGEYGVRRPTAVLKLAKHIHDHSYDLVHVHLFPAQLWTPLAVRLLGGRLPLVTTEHNTYNRRRKPWFRALDRWMYSQYASIACISEATASSLIAWLPEVSGKLQLVPNGISIEQFRDAQALPKEQFAASADSPVILFVARFDAQKDHATVLRAVATLPKAHLVLVGDGPTRAQMQALALTLGISERVHFLGRRQDVPKLIKMADVYVHSSHWEGFGIAALEAMAGGLPVVASRVPGLMDVVGEAGLLFETGDVQALALRVADVLSSAQTRADLIERGQRRAAGYSIEQTAERYIALYRSALSR